MTLSRKALIAAIALLAPALAIGPALAASSTAPKKTHHSSAHNASHKSHGTHSSATPTG